MVSLLTLKTLYYIPILGGFNEKCQNNYAVRKRRRKQS